MEYGDNDTLATEQRVEDWVIDKCNTWRDHYEANYAVKYEEKAPKAMRILEEGFDDAVAILSLPEKYRKRLRMTKTI